jgi:hypothetical protein
MTPRRDMDHRKPRQSRSGSVLALVVLVLAGCGGNAQPHAADAGSPAASAPLPARTPYLRMQDADNGWAVWPSGASWVVLHTTDGWHNVENVTPAAVPTGGGLVLGVGTQGAAAVAVEPYKRLLSSPLLSRTGPTVQWSPAELPGAVADSRQAVSLSPKGTTVVLEGGTVVRGGTAGWTSLTATSKLAPGGQLRLDAVTWADGDLGWLTGHGAKGAPMALQSTDGGQSWSPVSLATGPAVAALAPCGSGKSWVLPIVTADGHITVDRTTNGGATWVAGGSFAAPAGIPAWGCRGPEVWMVGHAEHLFASSDTGATWSDRGKAPADLTDLAPSSPDAGFATSGDPQHPVLWAVSKGGAAFGRISLPSWVSALGAQMSDS